MTEIDMATCDLRTGVARPPDPLDYITKKTACRMAPAGTSHPLWTAFLDRITGSNAELQRFLQRYAGYCCTGLTTEHVFVFAHGVGANGKSTFVNTIANIFGDYATIADMNTFIASSNERHPTDLAKLRGARLVVAQETQRGRRWDETKIKALTGGDRITARFMRQDFFDFTPTFKLFIAGNHKPRLNNVGEAIRRRLLLVPFTVQIPPDERDPDLPHKLEAEWPAILRWCVEGCLEWQRIGLAPPAVVRAATDAYFAEQDVVGQWLEDCTHDAGPLAFARVSALFGSWKTWCEDRNIKPGSSAGFADTLADRGFARKRESGTGQRGFANLVLGKL
jgi:putative DNA primase/helicase